MRIGEFDELITSGDRRDESQKSECKAHLNKGTPSKSYVIFSEIALSIPV
jgi:hypothetical protein